MTDEPGVRIEGLANLVRTMKRAGLDISELKDAHKHVGDIVAREARARAPRRTGKLASSVKAARQQGRARVTAGSARVPYAAPIHWGWPSRGIAARPFVSDAARDTEPQWVAVYVRDVEQALAKVRGI